MAETTIADEARVVGPERKDIHSFTTDELLDELSGRAEVECAFASSREMTVCVASAGPCLVLKIDRSGGE